MMRTRRPRALVVYSLATIIVIVVCATAIIVVWPIWEDHQIVTGFLEAAKTEREPYDILEDFNGTHHGIELLMEHLEEEHPRLQTVARAFGEIGDRAVPAIPLLLDRAVRNNNIWCLTAIGSMGPRAKSATQELLAIRNGKNRADYLGTHAAFALWEIDPELEKRQWHNRQITCSKLPGLPKRIEYSGTFATTPEFPVRNTVVKLIRVRPDGTEVTMNSANVRPIQLEDGSWSVQGEIELRNAGDRFDLAVVRGRINILRTPVALTENSASSSP